MVVTAVCVCVCVCVCVVCVCVCERVRERERENIQYIHVLRRMEILCSLLLTYDYSLIHRCCYLMVLIIITHLLMYHCVYGEMTVSTTNKQTIGSRYFATSITFNLIGLLIVFSEDANRLWH
jgi:hypothetical protein